MGTVKQQRELPRPPESPTSSGDAAKRETFFEHNTHCPEGAKNDTCAFSPFAFSKLTMLTLLRSRREADELPRITSDVSVQCEARRIVTA